MLNLIFDGHDMRSRGACILGFNKNPQGSSSVIGGKGYTIRFFHEGEKKIDDELVNHEPICIFRIWVWDTNSNNDGSLRGCSSIYMANNLDVREKKGSLTFPNTITGSKDLKSDRSMTNKSCFYGFVVDTKVKEFGIDRCY